MAETKRGVVMESGPRKRLFGLRFKMFFLFFFIPIVLIIAAGLVYINYMGTLSGLITKESSQLVTKMAEEAIAEKGRAVASAVKLYLETHPNLAKENFQNDPTFKALSVVKVGETGYTVVINGPTENEPCRIWAHPKDNLIGVEIIKAIYAKQGREAGEAFEKIHLTAFKTKKESMGYYRFLDGEKYMVIVPVEGTNFFIPSTTYIPEFTSPMIELQARANRLTERAIHTVTIVLAGTAILIALIVVIYSYRLSGRLKSLSDAADRISLGNIDAEIKEIKSKDEIEDLTDAFSRMQASIRLAINRLKERK